jgi:hypothetical protein
MKEMVFSEHFKTRLMERFSVQPSELVLSDMEFIGWGSDGKVKVLLPYIRAVMVMTFSGYCITVYPKK